MTTQEYIQEELNRLRETERDIKTFAQAQLQLLQAQIEDAEKRLKEAQEKEKAEAPK